MTTDPAAPLVLMHSRVKSEWIDYNRHMMDGYYAVAFSPVVDAFMNLIGLDESYRALTACTIYTAEMHIVFLRELKAGAPLRFEAQLLGHDTKRFHLFFTLHHDAEGYVAATAEFMLLHVDQHQMRVVPMPSNALARLDAIAERHRLLPQPPQAGRRVSMNGAARATSAQTE
ncbi:MAG: thioesterase family protein [Chloroflexi bacterium]|nr:thioesterase family protein [Chloroflexota bacterium]